MAALRLVLALPISADRELSGIQGYRLATRLDRQGTKTSRGPISACVTITIRARRSPGGAPSSSPERVRTPLYAERSVGSLLQRILSRRRSSFAVEKVGLPSSVATAQRATRLCPTVEHRQEGSNAGMQKVSALVGYAPGHESLEPTAQEEPEHDTDEQGHGDGDGQSNGDG